MAAEDEAEQYASHGDRLSWVIEGLKLRRGEIAYELRTAFGKFIEQRTTEWIVFDRVTADDLATAFISHPSVLKCITALCNVATRAIKRDLGFDIDTYRPRLTVARANQLAGYLKPFLPSAVAVSALEHIDDFWYIDKEIRAYQGRWERHTSDALTRRTGLEFKKRKFPVVDENGDSQDFELDAASPPTGHPIAYAVDVKRIGHPLDIHKRVDEIAQKARKFKETYPGGKFGSVIYYPFNALEQTNIVTRLRSPNVDGIVFAGESKESVERAILLLIPQLGLEVVDDTSPSSLFEELEDLDPPS